MENSGNFMHESYKKWLEDNKPKVYCNCPCNGELEETKWWKYNGIPKYILGHYIYSEKDKQKMKENHADFSGENHPQYGTHHSEETKQKIRDNHADMSGENHPDFSLDKNPNWKGGISFDPYCEKFNEKKREEVRNNYNRQCYICGRKEKDNLTKRGKMWKLSIHHVDNDKEQGCNEKPWKLVPLCLHCHNSKKMENLK